MTSRPLEGIRLLEWGTMHSAPAAGYILGDLGAEVIKIEEPVKGDAARGMETFAGVAMFLEPGHRNIFFETANRNKKSITLDLKKEKGKEVLHRLVARCDVFYTNFRRSTAQRLGLDYSTLKQYNPRLIYAIATGYGSRGPEREKRSYDPIALARSGIMYAAGDRDFPEPSFIAGGIIDQMGATMLAFGIVTALLTRERTGVGQEVEVSLLGSALHAQAININTALLRGRSLPRHSRRRTRNPLTNHYRCADGQWLLLCEPQSERFWHPFCQALGLEELERGPRFDDGWKRRENCQELNALLAEVFATKPREDWLRLLEEKGNGIAVAPIQDVTEAAHDPQAQANDYVARFQDPELGEVRVVGFPIAFSETPPAITRLAPHLGQHTEEVLREVAGYTWEEIAQLREEWVI